MDKKSKIKTSGNVSIAPAERLTAFEKEKMSRRAVLGRFGLLAGAAVAALTADELTRMVGSELERRSAGNKAIEQVAKELKNAGVAFALPPDEVHPPGSPFPGCDHVDAYCLQHCGGNIPHQGYSHCVQCCNGVFSSGGSCGTDTFKKTKCLRACCDCSDAPVNTQNPLSPCYKPIPPGGSE